MAQKIETPGGETLALLPWDEYEALVAAAEDRAEIRSYDAAKARLAAGEDEVIPPAFARRLLDGENPIRVYRDLRGISARDLAAATGISPSYLSQIETGRRQGTAETLKLLAERLGVALDDLA